MSNVIVCSVCSKEKSKEPGLIPARLRYRGSHISRAGGLASGLGVPLFILSGVHGLLAEDAGVEYYDRLLLQEGVPALTEIIKEQLIKLDVKEIYFFAKFNKPNWEPYRRALWDAARALSITLNIRELEDDD